MKTMHPKAEVGPSNRKRVELDGELSPTQARALLKLHFSSSDVERMRVLSAKARALSRRRYHVTYEDITSLAIPVLRHRILLNFHAESDRIDSDHLLHRLLETMPPPSGA